MSHIGQELNLYKLNLRSSRCVFLGYPADFRGYRCLDFSTGKVILSRHVTFDESVFPFANPTTTHDYSFLDSDPSPIIFQTPVPTDKSTSPNIIDQPTSPNTPSEQSNTSNTPGRYGLTYTRTPRQPPPTSPPPSATVHLPSPPSPPPPPPPSHPMTTRTKDGTIKPRVPFNLHTQSVTSISPLPSSHLKALDDPNWRAAMNEEFRALIDSNTWVLVPRPPDTKIIRCMWLYRHKFNADGTLQRYKARLVVNGKSQRIGIDCEETFSPVVKPTTIRTVLNLAVSRNWPIHQLDVKNAFLHGDLKETVYMFQPPGFSDSTHPNFVCRLRKSLYGLKQAPRAWYDRFATYLIKCGFKSTISDNSLFVYRKGNQMAYLLLYVDDIILTASNDCLLRNIISSLSSEFSMSDLGNLHHFLGIQVSKQHGGFFLSQSNYALEILARANMSDCKPSATPVDTNSKLSANSGNLLSDGTLYRQLAGALQYITFTRPDLTYAVQQICLFMHAPRDPHFQFLKRVLRYLKGTIDYGLSIIPSRTQQLVAYSDADWGGCPDSRRSTSGYCVFLGNNIVSWSSKRQPTISRSSAEAEYRGVANVAAEVSWLRNLLLELFVPVRKATIVYCDNVSAVYLSENPVQHQRTKHVELDIHFVREKVRLGDIRVLHVPADFQYADIFTKGLPRQLFTRFRSSLCLRPSPASTAGAY